MQTFKKKKIIKDSFFTLKCLQQPSLCHAKAKSQKSMWAFHVCDMDSATGLVTSCLPGCASAGSWKWKWN